MTYRTRSMPVRILEETPMKRSYVYSGIYAGAMALTLLSGTAMAQDSETLTIQTTVAPYCKALPTSGSVLQLGELADGNGFVVDEFAGFNVIGISLSHWCNAPTTVTLSTVPLTHTEVTTVTDPASFTNRVEYKAAWYWGSFDRSKLTTAGDDVFPVNTANIGPLSIAVTDPFTVGNKRPIGGDYVGAVTITIAAQ